MSCRLYAKKVASRRYRVLVCLKNTPPLKILAYASGCIAIDSHRPYPRGAIINPTKVIKQLIAERAAA